MRACGLVDAGDESRASGCARRRRAMGAPFGSAICAKRKRSFPARDCFENPGASLMSESSSLGSCRSSTRVPFWQQIDGFVTVKRSAPQFMHTSRCSKKLIGCAASRLLKHVAFCRHSRRYCTPSASDGHRGTRAAPTVVGAAAHERTLYSRVLIWPEEESRYWRGSFSIVNVSKTASVGVSGVRRARAGIRSSNGRLSRLAGCTRDESSAVVSHGSSRPAPSTLWSRCPACNARWRAFHLACRILSKASHVASVSDSSRAHSRYALAVRKRFRVGRVSPVKSPASSDRLIRSRPTRPFSCAHARCGSPAGERGTG